MAFDPCREWLGIAAVDLTDPRKVLGLPPGLVTADAVSAAAAARLEVLGQVRPGPFAKAHAALVTRVHEARDQLLGQTATLTPSLPPLSSAPLPPPVAARMAPPVADAFRPAEPAPVSLAADDHPPAAGLELPPGPVVARRVTASRRSRSSAGGGLLLGSIALLAAAVAVLAFFVSQGWTGRRQVATKPPVKGNTVPEAPPAPPKTNPQQPDRAAPAPVEPRPEPPMTNEPDPARVREAEERAAREREAKRAADEARRQKDLQTAEKQAAEKQAAEKKAADEKAAEAQRQADAEMRAKLAEAVENSLRDAYAAIQRGEFDTAKRAIASAGKQVGDDVEQATRVERWNLFATYAGEFPKYRDQALAAANAGREYDLDGKKFAVVEVTPETFIYRMAGGNVRVPRDAIDPKMLMAIVETWFAADGRAANHLFLGAHWLAVSPPDTRRARAEWQVAGDGGENVAPLMALLDDPVIRRAGR